MPRSSLRRALLALAALAAAGRPAAGASGSAPATDVHAAIGVLDVADERFFAGWAKDDDFDGPVMVHVYVDGKMIQRLKADLPRKDVGAHAFHWVHEPFGAGPHEVRAYVIGVDSSGAPDGANLELIGSGKRFSASCDGLTGSPREWCDDNKEYWIDRQRDTEYLNGPNERVRLGVNRSYGGTVFQLFGYDWTRNLICEHGGAAVQLSLWGMEKVGPVAWFSNGPACDATRYETQGACLKKHAAEGCSPREASLGRDVADCKTVLPCNGWGAGAPWNFIQAQGARCQWADATNDADAFTASPAAIVARLDKVNMFTKTRDPLPGLKVLQTATVGDAYARLDYTIDYQGKIPMSLTPGQEIPAVWTAPGINAVYSYPSSGGVRQLRRAQVAARIAAGDANVPITDLNEPWISACDDSGARCLTVAVKSALASEAAVSLNEPGSPDGGCGYETPMGRFRLTPGFHGQVSVFLFPFRYDALVEGRTVRDRIADLLGAKGPPGITGSAY